MFLKITDQIATYRGMQVAVVAKYGDKSLMIINSNKFKEENTK